MYVTAGVALVGAVCAALLIRSKDFHRPDAPPADGGPDGPSAAEEAAARRAA
jgi:hypothetical protein